MKSGQYEQDIGAVVSSGKFRPEVQSWDDVTSEKGKANLLPRKRPSSGFLTIESSSSLVENKDSPIPRWIPVGGRDMRV